MPTNNTTANSLADNQRNEQVNEFFSHVIDNLKTDHFLLTEDIASDEQKRFYNDMIFGDKTMVVSKIRQDVSFYFIEHIIKDYIAELKASKKKPLKLALGLSDSKLLVWSEIEDGDEETEDALLLAEAKTNGKYYTHGFYLNSTIVEQSDKLDIPPHYYKIFG